MHIAESIKHAPRWTWYAILGVGGGATAIKVYKNRHASDLTTSDGTPTTDPTVMGTDPSTLGGSALVSPSPAGVIVPPVIMGGGSTDQSGTGLGDLQNLYMGGVGNLMDLYANAWGSMQAQQSSLLDTSVGAIANIAATAGAGSAPQPAYQNPTPVIVQVQAPPRPPQPRPAAPPPRDPCPGTRFPFQGPHGCYQVACANGRGGKAKGRWHIYANGTEEHVSNSC